MLYIFMEIIVILNISYILKISDLSFCGTYHKADSLLQSYLGFIGHVMLLKIVVDVVNSKTDALNHLLWKLKE